MKKILVLAASLLVGSFAFADTEMVTSAASGLKVTGYIRAGVTDDVRDDVFNANTYMGGDVLGGSSRLRLNIDYEGNLGGATFRYQKTGNFSDSDWFESDNIKWAMAFANFFDGKMILEAGRMRDRFTRTGGDWDGGFDQEINLTHGARVVFNPIKGLYLTGMISDLFADRYDEERKWQIGFVRDVSLKPEDSIEFYIDGYKNPLYLQKNYLSDKAQRRNGAIKFNHKLFSASAKYENDSFFVTAGAHAAKVFYGSFGLKAIKDLTAVVEFIGDYSYENSFDDTTTLVATVEYSGIDKITLGVVNYNYFGKKSSEVKVDGLYVNGQKVIDFPFTVITEKDVFDSVLRGSEIKPYIQFDLNNLLRFAVESDIFYSSAKAADDDWSFSITPSVTFKASENAHFVLWSTIWDETFDYSRDHNPTVGLGVRYDF